MNYFKRHLSRISSESGATLIMIIIAMIVIAVLGVGLYTLSMTSALTQVEAQKAAKAYYISESCVRIAASEYKAAANKNSKLVELNGKTFTMPNNQGSCTVEIFPYWFYTTAAYAAGTNSMTIYIPGTVPRISSDETSTDYTTSVTFPSSGYLRIKDQGRTPAWTGSTELQYTSCSNCAPPYSVGASGTAVTFTLSAPLTNATIIGEEFYLGYAYTLPAIPVTINAGDNLVLNIDTNDLTGKIFPPEKGSIFFDQSGIIQLRYDKRNIDTDAHTVTITNIQPLGSTTLPVTITSNPRIYMGKSLGFRSDATYGN